VQSNTLFQKLVDRDPALAALLSNRDPIIRLPAGGGNQNGVQDGPANFDGAYSPSFLRLEERFEKHGLEVPINRSRPVAARTDAENGYLQRADNGGRVIIPDIIRERFTVREQLVNGRLTIFLNAIEGKVAKGETFSFRIGLHDQALAEPVYSQEVTLRVIEQEAEPAAASRPKSRDGQKGSDEKNSRPGAKAPSHGLPSCVLLTKDGREVEGYTSERWPDGFTEHDGGEIRDLGSGEIVYKINYDNAYHLKHRLGQRGDVAREVVTEKYILGMRILLLGYEHALRSLQDARGGELNGFAEYADDFRRMAARGAASTVLSLADNLPKIVDASAVQQQDVE
jgi:hypothetical protein